MMDEKILFQDEDAFQQWCASYIRVGTDVTNAQQCPPDHYPCLVAYHIYDISNSMRWGYGMNVIYVYQEDFNIEV